MAMDKKYHMVMFMLELQLTNAIIKISYSKMNNRSFILALNK